MDWSLEEAVAHYRAMGAPGDQQALISLLREVQREKGGIPRGLLAGIAEEYGIKEALLLALIRRIPSLRLTDSHILEVCSGKNCRKRADLMGVWNGTMGKRTVLRSNTSLVCAIAAKAPMSAGMGRFTTRPMKR